MVTIHHGEGFNLNSILEEKFLLATPFTDLKIADIRQIVELYTQPHPYNNACIVAGPIDDASRESILDPLLKPMEEPIEGAPILILWAYDIADVPAPIRSRCAQKYHPSLTLTTRYSELGNDLLDCLYNKDRLGMLQLLKDYPDKGEILVIEALLNALLKSEDYLRAVKVWDFIKLKGMPFKGSKASLYAILLSLYKGIDNGSL